MSTIYREFYNYAVFSCDGPQPPLRLRILVGEVLKNFRKYGYHALEWQFENAEIWGFDSENHAQEVLKDLAKEGFFTIGPKYEHDHREVVRFGPENDFIERTYGCRYAHALKESGEIDLLGPAVWASANACYKSLSDKRPVIEKVKAKLRLDDNDLAPYSDIFTNFEECAKNLREDKAAIDSGPIIDSLAKYKRSAKRTPKTLKVNLNGFDTALLNLAAGMSDLSLEDFITKVSLGFAETLALKQQELENTD